MGISWVGRLVVAIAAAALCYLAAVAALATTMRSQPDIGLRLAPFSASARAGAAYKLIESDQSRATIAKARELARRAIVREPVNVVALRTLGLSASLSGDVSQAKAYFSLVERLSRRDLQSQLWWIEYEVARNSITGALRYFDEALRTSGRSADLLMPILVNAAADAPVANALAPLLAKRPTYFRPFFIQAADEMPNVDQAVRLGTRLLNPKSPDDQDLINRLLLRLERDGKFDSAWRLYTSATGRTGSELITNGDFERPGPFRLFDWTPTNNDSLTAEIAPRDDSNALYLIARVSRGLAARQMLRLPPGHYMLDAVTGDVPDAPLDRPTVEIRCATGDQRSLGSMRFPAAPRPATPFGNGFAVGADCRYQWLDLLASASSEDETRAWIDNIRIRPARGNR